MDLAGPPKQLLAKTASEKSFIYMDDYVCICYYKAAIDTHY